MNLKSYYIYSSIFVFLGFLISGSTYAEESGNCELRDETNKTISPYEWQYGIELAAIDDVEKTRTVLGRFSSKNILQINNTYNNDQEKKQYLSVYSEDDSDHSNYIVIRIGEEFENYEDEEISTKLKLRIKFLCQNQKFREIEFRIPIIDSNNHSPQFLDHSYSFTVPMPIPQALFTENIMLRDVDLTNERITLNFDEDEDLKGKFLISSAVPDSQNKKNYLAKLISSTMIDLEDDITFTLTATDSGNPPRTTNTTVNIIVDKKKSFPRFAHSLYTANLTKIDHKKADKISVEFAEGNITVTRGYQGIEKIMIRECSDENEKHLVLTDNGGLSNHGLVTYMELNNLTGEFLKQKVINVVLATVGGPVEATTVIQILLPGLYTEISNEEVPNRDCQTSENAVVLNDESTNGYMVATIVLSVISIVLIVFIIFLYLKKEMYRYVSKIYERSV